MNIFFENIVSQLHSIFNPASLGEHFGGLISKAIIGATVFFVFYLAWLVVLMGLRYIFRRSGTDPMTSTFLSTFVKYTLLAIAMVTAFDSMGIKVSAVLASLGIAGLTIGFAARDSLSNVIAGILIFLDRPFVIGDLVEIDGFYGRVDRITLRSTRIVTVDGKMLAVPNTEIINKTVASYTNFPHLRLDIAVTIAVSENIDRVRAILLSLVSDKEVYLDNPPQRVVVAALNDYNVRLELQVWLNDERQHVEKRFELREKTFKALTEAGIEMPFETFTINTSDPVAKGH